MDLQNKVALITGGARMGDAIGRALAREGTDVVFSYRSSKRSAERAAQRAAARGRKALAIQADFTDKNQARSLVNRIQRSFGRLDILIWLASVYEETPWSRLRFSDWEANLNIHVHSAQSLAREAAPLMKKSGGGRMIFTSDWTSASGRPRYKNLLPYYVSKHAVLGLVEGLALELAPDILVNAIAPGPILPPSGLSLKDENEVVNHTPLKRRGGADEIAKAVLFLIETDFVTGERIRVDGGRHLY